ncbi:MAG: membrane integrity-associated transporter subunit PqiC [Granulosicoccus sp.]
MKLISGRWILALLTTVVVSVSACSSGPPPKLYLLDARTAEGSTSETESASLTALGISQVKLPGYASDPRIASSGGDGLIVLLDSERWAEEPEDAITRLLSERLRVHATATVLVEPWPRDYSPQARVEVVFDRLLREADGGAHLAGQIQLLSGNGRKLLRSLPFDYRAPGISTDITEFFRIVALGVDDIARIAVESLLAMKIKS